MPSRTFPGIGLVGGWSSGEDGYGNAMNTNLIMLSTLCQMTALNVMESLPSTPADGEIYLLEATAAHNPGKIAIRDDGMWRYIQPVVGWECFVQANQTRYRFAGGGWIAIATAAQIPPYSIAQANYILGVNLDGTGVRWQAPYEPTYEIPVFQLSDVGKQLEIGTDAGGDATLKWAEKPLSLPVIPAGSKGKVAVVDQTGAALTYEEDGKYKAVAPGYVAIDDDFTGRVILGATGNITIPANLTRGSTLTIVRMSTNEVEILAGSGVTLNVADGRKKLRSRYSAVSVVKTGNNSYVMFGDVAT